MLSAVVPRVSIAVCLLASVSACGSSGGGGYAKGAYKVGSPYTINGVTYTPMEEFTHVETGMASWYGPGFHGRATANGERYDQNDRTAAHRTLQMPSIVRVTNLDNGLSTVVRINDRGPYARDRVIDMSRAAATELDMMKSGTARVRIEQLSAESQTVKEVAVNGGGPVDQKEALEKLAQGKRSGANPVMTASGQATAPTPSVVQSGWPENPRTPTAAAGAAGVGNRAPAAPPPAPVPVPPSGGFYVQTGAFSTMANAERQRGAVTSYGVSEIAQGSAAGRDVYRVRIGPYTTADAAGIVADRLKRSGFGDARVVSD